MSSLEEKLDEFLESCVVDPARYVLGAFPWRERGVLAEHDGPDRWQRRLLDTLGEQLRAGKSPRISTTSGHGVGKVQCNHIVVPTPSGERQWGDIQVGDFLFDREGRPTRVLKRFNHANWPFYRVEFDDGSFTLAGPEHLWAVRGRQERRNNRPGWRIMSTEEIMEAGVLRSNGVAMAKQWEIPTQEPVQFAPREIPVHPYILGIWLGDGTRGSAQYCKPYPEIAERIRGFGVAVSDQADGKTHGLLGQGAGLREAGVLDLYGHERVVPDDYKFNTHEVRRLVLEGLLDTDGECGITNSTICFSSTSRRLAEDVVWLARSLGGKAMIQPTPKQGWYPDENGLRKVCRTCYRITLNLPWNPFTLEHRRKRYKPSEERYTKRWISKIEFDHFGDGHCVIVDNPERLYQTNDFIVTHNSALVAWVILWFISTRPHPQIVVTANTRDQLLKKTFREVAVWHKRAINGHRLTWTATKLYDKRHPETWFAAAIPWSAENSESFAGTHEQHVLIIYDEASAIHDAIWDVTQGAMTTKGAVWLAFGNPTRNSGMFYETFHKFKHRWTNFKVDSREAKMTDKAQLQQWVDDYGEDSDFVRVRVKGEFPRAGSTQFIPGDWVERAVRNLIAVDPEAVKILGVDVARFGDDQSIILKREGAKVRPLVKYRGMDLMTLAAEVAREIDDWEPDAVFVDGTGLGGGVVDRLRQLNYRVVDVIGAAKADDEEKYVNKRAEMWGKMKEWLKGDVSLPDDSGLVSGLTNLEYGYSAKMQIQLEKKSDMKDRGLDSPDEADALALTFAEPVRSRESLLLIPDFYGRGRIRTRRADLDWRVI